MSDYWKLDIKDYTLVELKNLFGLQEPHNLEDIITAHGKLTDRINTDGSIDSNKKTQILTFLGTVREKLIDSQKKDTAHLQSTHVHPTHMVQKRNIPKSFIYGGSPVNFKGVPMPVYKKVLAINSKFRDDYYGTLSTDFLLNLPTKISQIMSLELTGFEFPNTYFQISKALENNFLWVGWQKTVALTLNWYYISIPDGTYNREEMQSIINVQLQKATGKSALECPQCVIDKASLRTLFSLPTTTSNPNAFLQLAFNRSRGPTQDGKSYTITDASQVNLSPAPINNNSTIVKNFGWILGFRMAEYKASTTYISEGLYDSWGTKYIYVIVNDFNKNFSNLIEPVYNSSLGRDNILARVSLAPLLSTISNGTSLADQFNPGDYIRNYFGPVDLEKMRITFTDEFGRVINLNNMDLSLAITCTCLY